MFRQDVKAKRCEGQGWFHAAVLLAVLALTSGVQAQDGSTATAPESGARPELIEQLQQIDTQLAQATEAGNQENIDSLTDLKAQFEILLLQAELEALQQENTGLREQTTAAESSGVEAAASGSAEDQITDMTEEFDTFNAEQANVLEQLNKIADQHALLFQQLEGTEEAVPAQTVDQATNGDARLQQELTALQSRFETLVAQQSAVNAEAASISDQHAELLTALAAPPAPAALAPVSSYTVQEGDSLSGIAKAAYGSAARWPEILAANNTNLTNPDVLYVGTVLTIP